MNRLFYYYSLSFLLAGILCVPLKAASNNPIRVLLKENRIEEALAICRQFEVLNTNDTDALLNCALVYFRAEKPAMAEKILDQTKRHSSMPEYQLMQAYSKIAKKDYSGADLLLQNLKLQHKGKAIAVAAEELRGESKELQGDLRTAAFIYNMLVKDEPNSGRIHWALGRHYKNESERRKDPGDLHRAIQNLEKTTRLWPKHFESRYLLAQIYLDQGPDGLQDAGTWLNECYKLNKAEPRSLEQLGVLFERKGKIPEAIKYWQKTLEVKKDSKIASEKLNQYFSQQVDALMDLKRWKDALAKIESSSRAISDQPEYILRKAIILRNLALDEKNNLDKNTVDKAIAEFHKYLRSKPTDAMALRELGICYYNLKKIDQANIYFSKAVSNEPTNGMNHAWMAFGLESKGDLGHAREYWLKAVELLKDPVELEKANRKLSSIEKKISKKDKDKDGDE